MTSANHIFLLIFSFFTDKILSMAYNTTVDGENLSSLIRKYLVNFHILNKHFSIIWFESFFVRVIYPKILYEGV